MSHSQPPDAVSIRVTSLGIKFYFRYEKRSGNHPLTSILARRRKQDFWALEDISFEAKKGEILGIVGPNGAGKSTLLKIMADIFPATTGSVEVKGSVAPLIELGGTFNPELTGIENIFLTGSIFKVPRSVVKENLDKIIEFSGLSQFINAPIKNYSSGMFIRLAFSIIIFFQPEIVLIDEVFAVGDESFQQKSFEKILGFKKKGATIVLVSHDSRTISQICDRVLVLNKGRLHYLGQTAEAIDIYHRLLQSGEDLDSDTRLEGTKALDALSRRWGNKLVEITRVTFTDGAGRLKRSFSPGERFEARIEYVSALEDETPVFGVAISTIYKLLIYGPNTLGADMKGSIGKRGLVKFIIPELPLLEGDYLFSASAYDLSLRLAYDHHELMYHFRVERSGDREFGCVRITSFWEAETD